MSQYTRPTIADMQATYGALNDRCFVTAENDSWVLKESGTAESIPNIYNATRMINDGQANFRWEKIIDDNVAQGGGGFAPDPTGEAIGDIIKVNATQDGYEFGAPDGGGDTQMFIYRPAGSAAGNVYTDINLLKTAHDAASGLKTILFDNTGGTPGADIAVAALTWDLSDTRLAGRTGDFVTSAQPVAFADGTVFTTWPRDMDTIKPKFNTTSGAVYTAAAGVQAAAIFNTNIDWQGNNPVVAATTGGVVFSMTCDLVSSFTRSSGTGLFIDIGANTISQFIFLSRSGFSGDILADGSTGNLNVFYDSTVSIDGFDFTTLETTGAVTFNPYLTNSHRTETGASYTATGRDQIIIFNSASAPATLSLDSASNSGAGRRLIIKNIHATGTVTIDPTGSEEIDGAITKTLASQYAFLEIVSNGGANNWSIISQGGTIT